MIRNLFTCTHSRAVAYWYILWPILEWWDDLKKVMGLSPVECR
jgi:hypothetical protein